jgi:hypothetical protein
MTLKAFYIRYSLWAAILYALSVAIFLLFRNYANFWILYIGNMLFGAVVYVGVLRANHRMHDTGSLKSLFMTGIKLSFYALLIATGITLLLFLINGMMANFSAPDSPPQSGNDTQPDVILTLLSHTLGGNAFMGVLASVLVSVVAKRNQKTEQGKTLY